MSKYMLQFGTTNQTIDAIKAIVHAVNMTLRKLKKNNVRNLILLEINLFRSYCAKHFTNRLAFD